MRITKADDDAAKEEKIRQISRLYACKSSNPERPPAEELVLYEIERLNSEDPDLHTIIMRYWDEKEIILEKEKMTYEEFHKRRRAGSPLLLSGGKNARFSGAFPF